MGKFKLLLIILIFSQSVFADDKCLEPVYVLDKGQAAPCSGVLLSPEASKKADEALQDAKYYKGLSEDLFKRRDLTNKEINILDQRLKLYIDLSQSQARQLSYSEWEKFGYLALGVIITGVAYKNLSP